MKFGRTYNWLFNIQLMYFFRRWIILQFLNEVDQIFKPLRSDPNKFLLLLFFFNDNPYGFMFSQLWVTLK